ncbi:hypothetical protein BH93_02470 [Rhodococcoides fascians A25f]|uniref:hypothetical protein n=1 Tax=Rhodococcoides fascians TaxID=1828 RepID=UPI00068C4263|nr:hypothetical protein [Rhodococcus fascians]QII04379.1 hypothetical protein BH93_02470 [Rhodococcus fascians A25f]
MADPLRVVEGHDFELQPVHQERPYWYTVDDLIDRYGYRREALVQLFGSATPCLGGELGWTVSTVVKVERDIIAPALRLAKASFVNATSADDALTRVDFDLP